MSSRYRPTGVEPVARPSTVGRLAELFWRIRLSIIRARWVEVNREVVPRPRHAEHLLRAGDAVEIVTLVGGGAAEADGLADKPLTIGKFTFRSRLITGTGKYASYELMRDCLAASGCEVTTVAVRRERLLDMEASNILEYLDLKLLSILPNTGDCLSAEWPIRHARPRLDLM